MDVIYSNHIANNGGWVEQEVKFWVDKKHVQVEYYWEINTNPNFDGGVFNPNLYDKQAHWSVGK